MTGFTFDSQRGDKVVKVEPAQVNAEPAPPPYRGGGRGGAAAGSGQRKGVAQGEATWLSPITRAGRWPDDLESFGPGLPELVAIALRSDAALETLTRLIDASRAAAEPKAPINYRRSLAIVETVGRDERDRERDTLVWRFVDAKGGAREILRLAILDFHDAREREEIRIALVKRWRAMFAQSESANAAAGRLANALDGRRSDYPKSAGDFEVNHLLDKIVCCGPKLSTRSIRADMTI
jgi:hypothetical protein